MKIKHRAGIKHHNADALSIFATKLCPRLDCPDPGHQVPKRNLSKTIEQAILCPILTCSQISAKDFDSDCAVVHSFMDEQIKDAQIRYPDLCQFIELFNGHTEKPQAKLLTGESSEVKILCSLCKQFKIVDGILYRVSKTDIDPWRLIIPRSIRTKILELFHDSKLAGHPGMTRMKSSIDLRLYWQLMRDDIESCGKCFRSCPMTKRGSGRGRALLIQELAGAPRLIPIQREAY